MQYQGQVFNWNDEKGFGFVEPKGGGQRAFVHIGAFSSPGRRPADGDQIIYNEVKQPDGRYCAAKIRYAGQRSKANTKAKTSGPGKVLFLLFCLFLLAAYFTGQVSVLVLAAYVLLSGITFAAYALDKAAAKRDRQRISERTLHILGVFGGWPGGYFARATLRHKSSKASFIKAFWVTVAVNVVALFWLSGEASVTWLNALLG